MKKTILTISCVLLLTGCSKNEEPLKVFNTEIDSPRVDKEIPAEEKEEEPKPQIVEKSTREKLLTLVYAQTKVDPETFSYPGCNISHGPDGDTKNWITMSEEKLKSALKLYTQAAKDYEVILMDYSKNPYGVSDKIGIVTCTCDDFTTLSQKIDESKLYLPDRLWHAKDRFNLENETMYPCLGDSMWD